MRIIKNIEDKRNLIRLGIALILFLLVGSYFLFITGQRESELLSPPVIKELDNNQVRIVWETASPEIGVLFYHKEGAHELEIREIEETTYHSISLRGLEPDTIYRFRLSEGSEEYYTFITPPPMDKDFRFLVFQRQGFLEAGWTDKLIELSNTQMPDFVVAVGDSRSDTYLPNERDFHKALHENTLGLPVYLIPGSEVLGLAENRERYVKQTEINTDFFFDFGNSRFIIIGPEIERGGVSLSQRREWLEEIVANTSLQNHIFILLTHYQMENATENSLLTVLNNLVNSEKIRAVFNVDYKNQAQVTGEKIYNIKESFMVVDVDVEGVTAQLGNYQTPEVEEVVIKDFPEAVKRSCVYCRKLFEKEQYEDSIQWYRDFIADFGDDYMVDDSQFEIANIYDRYLYDYENAIKEYRILINNYQYSNKIRQAQQRIEYLQSHSGYDFEPLKAFEKAKMEIFIQDVGQAIGEVENILEEYPDSSLEPQLLEWLGRNLAEINFEQSVLYLEKLATGDYGEKYREEALIALGDTLYANGKYNEAIETFQKAETEENREGLAGKIYRCRRNIRREIIKYIAIAVVVILLVAAIFKKPFFFTKEEAKLARILAIIYLFAGVLCWRTFFTNYPLLIRYIVALAITGAIAPMLILAVNRKVFNNFNVLWRKLLTFILTILLSLSVIYLAIYIYRVHYLVAFRL